MRPRRTLAAWGALFCAACGGAPPASITLINPTSGATVPLGTDPDRSVSVTFATTNFTVTATCNGASQCGRVYVFIDGTACDPVGQPYDALAVSSPATAIFASCAMPTGAHALSVELHTEDGTAVKGANGQTAAASVNITTQ
jgi:hypothetical protein